MRKLLLTSSGFALHVVKAVRRAEFANSFQSRFMPSTLYGAEVLAWVLAAWSITWLGTDFGVQPRRSFSLNRHCKELETISGSNSSLRTEKGSHTWPHTRVKSLACTLLLEHLEASFQTGPFAN